jgi:hypothetical protein
VVTGIPVFVVGPSPRFPIGASSGSRSLVAGAAIEYSFVGQRKSNEEGITNQGGRNKHESTHGLTTTFVLKYPPYVSAPAATAYD